MKYLPLIWSGLWRKRARTIFTMLSIVTAFLLFGMLQGVIGAFDRAVADSARGPPDSHQQGELHRAAALFVSQAAAIPSGVAGVSHLSWFGAGTRATKNQIFSFPTEPRPYFAMYPEIKLPPGQLEALIRTRNGAVIGRELANKYGWKIGDARALAFLHLDQARRQLGLGVRHRRHLRRSARTSRRASISITTISRKRAASVRARSAGTSSRSAIRNSPRRFLRLSMRALRIHPMRPRHRPKGNSRSGSSSSKATSISSCAPFSARCSSPCCSSPATP